LEAQSPPSTGLHEDRPGSDFAERRIVGANLRKRIARDGWNSNHVIGLERLSHARVLQHTCMCRRLGRQGLGTYYGHDWPQQAPQTHEFVLPLLDSVVR
jgi:hypothetical protein